MLLIGLRAFSRRLPRALPQYRSIARTSFRYRSNAYAQGAPKAARQKYPESLLIFHAGTGRITYTGCLKVTTIFVFIWACGVQAPSLYLNPDEPNWKAAVAVASGAMPMLFVVAATAPYVMYVHIRVPQFARRSKEALFRWAENVAPETELDLTTMRAYGKLRVSRLPIKDLRQSKSWTSLANLKRVSSESANLAAKRRWWMLKPVRSFYVGVERSRPEFSVWQQVLKRVPRAGSK